MAIIVSICIKNEILLLCSIVIIPINIANYLRQVYQAIGQFKKYSKFTNINTILILIVNIFLLFIVKTDYYRLYIFGYIGVYIIYWIFIEIETRKLFPLKKVNANKKYLIQDNFKDLNLEILVNAIKIILVIKYVTVLLLFIMVVYLA